MELRAQMLKGLLEGCILEIISEGETYGYEITEKLNQLGFVDLNEGTVYPVLMRLEKKGYVKTETKKSALGPKRKYFYMNTQGEMFLDDFKREWESLKSTMENIFKGGE
ncbi:MAG: PadR family transcriptional regulator [Clostridia bacterium]|nr:PadR family transcriptional regulator [Clostridia bacterium]